MQFPGRKVIDNVVQELSTNTSLLYEQMAVATETETLIPALPQKYVYLKQHPMQRQEYNGHPTFKIIHKNIPTNGILTVVKQKWFGIFQVSVKCSVSPPSWKGTQQATQFKAKSILSSFSVMRRQSDSCPHIREKACVLFRAMCSVQWAQ